MRVDGSVGEGGQATHRITVAEGVALSAEVAGAGSPLVLVPGAGGDRATWDDLWPTLTARHHCVRYDLRGCGESEDRTVETFRHADDLAALLDGLGLERVSVAGVSMGGRIAVDFALSHPDRVDRLVLISPNLAGWDWSESWRARWRELTRTAVDGDLDAARKLWFRHPLFEPARRDPELAARLWTAIAADTCRVWLDADRETPPDRPHVESLGELGMPVLLITGERDVEDLRLIAEIVTAMVPGLRRVDLPDTGHLPHVERPAETAAEMVAFLDATPNRTATATAAG